MTLKESMELARGRINRQLLERFQETGQTLTDYEVDCCIAEDDATLIMYIELPDGYIITAAVGNFVSMLQHEHAEPVRDGQVVH